MKCTPNTLRDPSKFASNSSKNGATTTLLARFNPSMNPGKILTCQCSKTSTKLSADWSKSWQRMELSSCSTTTPSTCLSNLKYGMICSKILRILFSIIITTKLGTIKRTIPPKFSAMSMRDTCSRLTISSTMSGSVSGRSVLIFALTGLVASMREMVCLSKNANA